MRFVSLEVSAFQAIASAKLELSPKLNVLFGPNDLGKSTLVTAIRAALLVAPKSVEANRFRSWFAQVPPRVSLTFEREGVVWRVAKQFEEGKGTAELYRSKDGRHFVVDAKGRDVDEHVRQLLSLGLETAGARGRGGVPDSFLVNTLLADQVSVDELLSRSIDDDSADSGKRTLSKALAALAQDPLFKRVLDRAQGEVARYFSETGRRRSGAKSPFALAGNTVRQLQQELAEARASLEQFASTERVVAELQQATKLARAREIEATELVAIARKGLEQATLQRSAQAELARAREAVARLDELDAAVVELRGELERAEAEVKKAEARQREVARKEETLRDEVRLAETSLTRAQQAGNSMARAMEAAAARQRLAETGESITRLEARRERAARAEETRRDAAQLRVSLEQLSKEHEALERGVSAARDAVTLSSMILDYGRWKTSAEAAERAEQLKVQASALASEAASARRTMKEKLEQLTGKRKRLDEAKGIPESDRINAFLELEHQRQLADAQTGGGVTIVVRPRDELRLNVEVDDEASVDEVLKANRERVVEAERKASVTIGQMVEIEVVTGSREARQLRDTLSKRWRSEVMPVLAQAAVSSLAELRRRREELDREGSEVLGLQAEIERLGQRAERSELHAKSLEQEAGKSESRETIEERAAKIPAAQRELIARSFLALGQTWERDAEALRAKHVRELEAVTRSSAATLSEIAAARARLAEAPSEESGEPLAQVAAELERALKEKTAAERAVAELERAQGSEVKSAEKALVAVRERAAEAQRDQSRLGAELERARQTRHERAGRLVELEAQLARADRAAAEAALEKAQSECVALGNGSSNVPDLIEAERLLAALRAQADLHEAEFHKAEGALSKTGGAAQRERVAQLEEALAVALAREAEIETEAASWQLLHSALRESENTESGHLGRALAEPVAAQFRDLTEGRYFGVEVGPQLTTSGVLAAGTSAEASEVLEALSVGTKDQLASLLRLAIARQLGSTLILDDHLVHTDQGRMSWFVDALRRTAAEAQVIVVTCRPADYVPREALAGGDAVRDLTDLRVVNLERVIEGYPGRSAR